MDGQIALALGLHPANERRRYFVTTSLIGWAQAYNQPCSKQIRSNVYILIYIQEPEKQVNGMFNANTPLKPCASQV